MALVFRATGIWSAVRKKPYSTVMTDRLSTWRASPRLEPDEGKLSCPVLRGESISNDALLPDFQQLYESGRMQEAACWAHVRRKFYDRDRRTKLDLDQKTLADKIGVSRQWIVAIEKGKPRAEIGLVLRALAALGTNLDATDIAKPIKQTAPRVYPVDIDAIVDAAREMNSEFLMVERA